MSPLAVRPPGRSANIFINYRREDSAGHAGRLFDGLSSHFPDRLFMDVDTIAPGVDFVDAIEKAVGACEVLIVVIGREWLSCKNAAGQRRLDDPSDFVRLELETALARNIRVIPVLVQDTPMPRPEDLPPSLARLARRNAIELSDVRWSYDVDRLAHTIQGVLGEETPAPLPETPQVPPVTVRESRPVGPRALIFVLAALLLVSVGWISKNRFQPATGAAADSRLNPAPAPAPTSPSVDPALPGPTPAPALSNPTPAPVPSNPAPAPVPVNPAPAPALVHPRPAPVYPNPAPFQAPVSPSPKQFADIKPVEPEPSPPAKVEDQEPAREPLHETLQLPGVTITSPKDGTKVGKHITAKGVISGLGAGQRAFLCMKNREGVTYPRGELFPGADGRWSAELDSSHHDYEIFVVIATSPAATEALTDGGNVKEGLRAFPPPGASIVGPVVSLDRQGKVADLLKPKRG